MQNGEDPLFSFACMKRFYRGVDPPIVGYGMGYLYINYRSVQSVLDAGTWRSGAGSPDSRSTRESEYTRGFALSSPAKRQYC